MPGFDSYEVKKTIIIFQKEKGNTFNHFHIKKSSKGQNSTNLCITMIPNLPEKSCNHPKVNQLQGD